MRQSHSSRMHLIRPLLLESLPNAGTLAKSQSSVTDFHVDILMPESKKNIHFIVAMMRQISNAPKGNVTGQLQLFNNSLFYLFISIILRIISSMIPYELSRRKLSHTNLLHVCGMSMLSSTKFSSLLITLAWFPFSTTSN